MDLFLAFDYSFVAFLKDCSHAVNHYVVHFNRTNKNVWYEVDKYISLVQMLTDSLVLLVNCNTDTMDLLCLRTGLKKQIKDELKQKKIIKVFSFHEGKVFCLLYSASK